MFERPNADLDLDEELDPELQALIDSEDIPAGRLSSDKPEAARGDEPSRAEGEAEDATGDVADPLAEPAEEKPEGEGFDMLSLFEETEVKDTKPAALREALKPCTIEELREEASAIRAILAGTSTGDRAA